MNGNKFTKSLDFLLFTILSVVLSLPKKMGFTASRASIAFCCVYVVMVLGIEGTQINEIICVLFMFQVIFKCQRILAESLSPNRKALFSPASMLKSIHCAMLCWMGKRRCHASLKVIQCQLIGKLNAKSKKYEPKRTKRRTPTPSWRKWKEITKWAHVESSKLVSLPKNCWRTIF